MRATLFAFAVFSCTALAAPATTVTGATTTFTKSLSCSTPNPTHYHCNVKGHVRAPAVLVQGTAASLNLCADACESNSKCLSFAYLNNNCVLYSENLSDQTIVTSAPKSTLYERHCISCAPSSTPTPTNTCASYSSSLRQAGKYTSAEKYCSSHLRASTVTSQALTTVTPATSTITITTTVTDGTSTATATDVETTTTTTTTTTQDTSTSTTTTTLYSATDLTCVTMATTLTAYSSTPAGKKRRAAQTITSTVVPTQSSMLSASCSCLSITQPPDSTITSTATHTAPTPSTTVTAASPVHVTATTTTTTTTTTTVTSIATSTLDPTSTTVTETYIQPTPSAFLGMQYYQYYNSYDYSNADPGFNAADWNGNEDYNLYGSVTDLSTIHTQSYPSGGTYCILPGQSSYINCAQITVVVQGFYFALVDGTYTISSPNTIDNAFYLWSGETAYTYYTNGNEDYAAERAGDGPYYGGSATYELAAGEYLPLTGIYVNGGGIGALFIDITTPDGTTYTSTAGSLVPACADGNPFTP